MFKGIQGIFFFVDHVVATSWYGSFVKQVQNCLVNRARK
jgi:hypothetical protein